MCELSGLEVRQFGWFDRCDGLYILDRRRG